MNKSLCDYDNCSIFNSYSTHFRLHFFPFLQPCGSCHLPSYQLWLFSDSAGHDAICADGQTDTARSKAGEYHALLSISNLIEKTALIIDNCDHPLQFYMSRVFLFKKFFVVLFWNCDDCGFEGYFLHNNIEYLGPNSQPCSAIK